MQTRFYIEKRKDEAGKLLLKDRPVFMSVSFPGDRLLLSTGIKANYHEWDPELQRLKSGFPGSWTSNGWLETLSETAQRAWIRVLSGQKTPDKEVFLRVYQELKPNYSRGFFDVFFLFLESGMSQWSTATYKKVRTIYKHLREFENSTEYGISFGKMNQDFLEQFQNFYVEKGNGQTTTHKAINILVWFLNWATESGYNVNLEFRKFYKLLDRSSGSPPSRLLFLKWDELSKIRNMDYKNRKVERVRDLFCFMSFTGLKFSELQSLKKTDIGDNEIYIPGKNQNPRRVLLNGPAREIHSLYKNKYFLNNTAFPSMSIITMNKYLKILALEAGLGRLVDSSNGDPVPLYTRLTAGMGVNTFLANAIRLDIPLEVISGFTGVQKDSRFRHIRMELEKAQMAKFDSLKRGQI